MDAPTSLCYWDFNNKNYIIIIRFLIFIKNESTEEYKQESPGNVELHVLEFILSCFICIHQSFA